MSNDSLASLWWLVQKCVHGTKGFKDMTQHFNLGISQPSNTFGFH